MSNILRIPARRPPPPSSPMDIDVPQIVTINQATAPSSEIDYEDDYVTDEEEVDQIIDDELLDLVPPVTAPARKLNGKGKAKAVHVPSPQSSNAPSTSKQQEPKSEQQQIPRLQPRKPGETYIDQQRVEKIMKAYGNASGDILPPSKDAVFLVSLATQEFIHRLATYSSKQAESHNRNVIKQEDLAYLTEVYSGLKFLQETIPHAIPLSTALAKRAVKENERILIATELVPSTSVAGISSTASVSHKKRQPPLPKTQTLSKGKTRTSARQANGRSSLPSASLPAPRPKRAAAQKGRSSWAANEKDVEEDDTKMYDIDPTPAPSSSSTPLGDEPVPNGKDWKQTSDRPMSSGRGGMMKGLGPGAYGKIGNLYNGGRSSASSNNEQDAVHPRSWGFSQEPPRNTGRTIYSDRTDEEARKAAVEAEEQLRYSRARQKFEQELMAQTIEKHPDESLHSEDSALTDNYPSSGQ